MSQKYPEGAIIFHPNGEKRKVLGVLNDIRFLSLINLFDEYYDGFSVQNLEKTGWTVEEAPWVPKEGEEYEYIDSELEICTADYGVLVYSDEKRTEIGNMFKPGTGQAQAAAERVKRAYKGE